MIRQLDEGTRRLNRLRRDDLDARFPGLLDLAISQGRAVLVGCPLPRSSTTRSEQVTLMWDEMRRLVAP